MIEGYTEGRWVGRTVLEGNDELGMELDGLFEEGLIDPRKVKGDGNDELGIELEG